MDISEIKNKIATLLKEGYGMESEGVKHIYSVFVNETYHAIVEDAGRMSFYPQSPLSQQQLLDALNSAGISAEIEQSAYNHTRKDIVIRSGHLEIRITDGLFAGQLVACSSLLFEYHEEYRYQAINVSYWTQEEFVEWIKKFIAIGHPIADQWHEIFYGSSSDANACIETICAIDEMLDRRIGNRKEGELFISIKKDEYQTYANYFVQIFRDLYNKPTIMKMNVVIDMKNKEESLEKVGTMMDIIDMGYDFLANKQFDVKNN